MKVHPLCAGENKSLENTTRTELGYTDTRFGSPEMYIVFGMLCGDVLVPDIAKPLRGASGVPRGHVRGHELQIPVVELDSTTMSNIAA